MGYDSRVDTFEHAQRVAELMMQPVKELLDRSTCHDRSKNLPPEVSVFDEYAPKLRASTFGSDEYKANLAAMGAGLQHHYRHNRHHPEHFAAGIAGMTLVDLVEMLADWKAATERHDNGDLARSLEYQRHRFAISGQLLQILWNTAKHFGWITTHGPDSPPATPTDTGAPDLAAVAQAVLDHRWDDDTGQSAWRAHNRHSHNMHCGICQHDIAAILAVAWPHLRRQLDPGVASVRGEGP